MNTTASLFNSPLVRYAAAVAIPLLAVATNAHAALAAAGDVSFVQGINGWNNTIQAVAYPATAIGVTCGGVSLLRSHGNWSEIGHSAMTWAGVGGLTLGVGSFLSMTPGVQGMLI